MSSINFPFVFFPLTDFMWWDEEREGVLIGHYLPGQSYNCPMVPRYDRLRAKCEQWAKEGKIRIVRVGGFSVKEFKTESGQSGRITVPVEAEEAN